MTVRESSSVKYFGSNDMDISSTNLFPAVARRFEQNAVAFVQGVGLGGRPTTFPE